MKADPSIDANPSTFAYTIGSICRSSSHSNRFSAKINIRVKIAATFFALFFLLKSNIFIFSIVYILYFSSSLSPFAHAKPMQNETRENGIGLAFSHLLQAYIKDSVVINPIFIFFRIQHSFHSHSLRICFGFCFCIGLRVFGCWSPFLKSKIVSMKDVSDDSYTICFRFHGIFFDKWFVCQTITCRNFLPLLRVRSHIFVLRCASNFVFMDISY